MYLEQVRLYIGVGRVEYQIGVGSTRHLGNILVPINNLRNEKDLILQHFDYVLVLAMHVVFVPRLCQLAVNSPHFPGDAFRLKRPSRTAFLEKLETYRAPRRSGRAVDRAQQVREVRNLSFHIPAERFRLAADVSEVYEIAVDVHVADRADRVTLFAVIREFPTGSVEEYRVEYTGDDLVHLSPFHGQLEENRPRIHSAGVSWPTAPEIPT